MSDMTKEERSLQIWQVLISAAYNRQLFTYELIADLIGVGKDGKGAIALGYYLGALMQYCKEKRFPPITALVVKKGTGKPGSGLRTLSRHPDRDREKVFKYAWFKEHPVQIHELTPFFSGRRKDYAHH